jgi:hypothetical protein
MYGNAIDADMAPSPDPDRLKRAASVAYTASEASPKARIAKASGALIAGSRPVFSCPQGDGAEESRPEEREQGAGNGYGTFLSGDRSQPRRYPVERSLR